MTTINNAIRRYKRKLSPGEILVYAAFIFFMLASLIVIGIGHYYVQPADEAYRLELEVMQEDQAIAQEYYRLWIKHGYPTVIYERDETPYFYNSRGEKCRFT